MSKINKEQILEALRAYVQRKGSQNNAAATMKGVSGATITQMFNRNWDRISDAMWRRVAAYVGILEGGHKKADTFLFQQMQAVLQKAQQGSVVLSLIAKAGSGKSFAAGYYETNGSNVYYVRCDDYWQRNDFIEEILRVLGINGDGLPKRKRITLIFKKFKEMERPMLILDEFDKLNDNVWQLFITLYNGLDGYCSIITISTALMKQRIERGLYRKKGYQEIYSRLGKDCSPLNEIDYEDVKEVCLTEGIDDENMIEELARKSEGDLRVLYRKIFALKN